VRVVYVTQTYILIIFKICLFTIKDRCDRFIVVGKFTRINLMSLVALHLTPSLRPIITLIACISIFLSSCGAPDGCGGKKMVVSPSMLPIRLSVDQSGDIDVSLVAGIVTPIGSVSISHPLTPPDDQEIYLIIQNRNLPEHQQQIVYKVCLSRNIKVTTNGKTVIAINQYRVVIDVTESVVETIEIWDENITPFTVAGPTCGGIPTSFIIGDEAKISLNPGYTISTAPRYYASVQAAATKNNNGAHAFLKDGDVVRMISGPICMNNQWLWQIESRHLGRMPNIQVWVAEATPLDRYLCPPSNPRC
jgi:hypothetical protein